MYGFRWKHFNKFFKHCYNLFRSTLIKVHFYAAKVAIKRSTYILSLMIYFFLVIGAWTWCSRSLYRWCFWPFPCWACGGMWIINFYFCTHLSPPGSSRLRLSYWITYFSSYKEVLNICLARMILFCIYYVQHCFWCKTQMGLYMKKVCNCWHCSACYVIRSS